jgi:REP element-mobilizing transposase RayT
LNDPYERFESFGTPPAKQGDYAYLLHIVRSLKSTGKGACILPHGVLFRGNAEADIRRALVRKGYIKGIIGLPANLFFGTGIPACLVVIDKGGAQARKGIFMIDAGGGFMKDGPKNRLRNMDIHKIVDVFNRQLDVPKYARMVPFTEIEKNDYNLNLPRYIDSQTPEDLQDIEGHLKGGIPAADVDALQRYWAVCPNLKAMLFKPSRNAAFQPAQPGNAGFQPAEERPGWPRSNHPKGWHSRGYLPHFDGSRVLQFLTFRLADSVPNECIERWKEELNWHAGLDADRPESVQLRKTIEHYEDAGHGACYLRDERIAQLVQEALLHFDGQRYRMIAWCIMPNHVHALVETTDTWLSSILHTWKSFTAQEANKMLGRSGPFWMPDYFDRYIRNDEHLQSTLDYIRENPIKGGLVQRAEEWPWMGGARASSPQCDSRCDQDGRAPAAPIYVDLAVEKSAIKAAIYEHPEFANFIAGMNAHFAAWRQKNVATLKALKAGCHPRAVIATLAEDLLAHYAGRPLMDPYDVYQHLMDYWAETMQDDCYLIAGDGWKAETTRIIEKDKKGKEKDKGWTCELIPKALIVARYFAKEQAAIDRLAVDLESVTARLSEMEEEHGGEEGAFASLDTVNKAGVTARLKEIKDDKESKDEVAVLTTWLELSGDEADLKKRQKEAEAALDGQAYAKYPKLSEAEIKTLVVDDKWLVALDVAIHGEMDRVSQQLTQRVKELAERYETPLPKIGGRVAELETKVNHHLERMGFIWK